MIHAISMLIALHSLPGTGDFYNFLKTPEPSYRFVTVKSAAGITELKLTSQTWQGSEWKHDLIMAQPMKLAAKGYAVLYVTGDNVEAQEVPYMRLLANRAGMPAAVLYQIPNQPLWDMKEDDLIAHTFERYIETGDAKWPLLFPMTKSVLKAMDALQESTKGSDNPITKFIVTGASKRGWTTWFVGAAGDPRVAAIAPMVIDNLNVAAQMKHQMEIWGEYSPQIEDYTKRGLQAKLSTPRGRELSLMIDPYTYRDRITMPTLIITGSNDPYWAPDAGSLYLRDLKQRHWTVTVPNVGHGLGDMQWAFNSVVALARAEAGLLQLPEFAGSLKVSGETLVATVSKGKPASTRVWVAKSESLHFSEAKWEPYELGSKELTALKLNKSNNYGAYLEGQFDLGGYRINLTTPVQLFALRTKVPVKPQTQP